MNWMNRAVLYTALCLGANAGVADSAGLEDLRQGEMRKLIVHAEPVPVPDIDFLDESGHELTLGGFRGQYVLLNFWATWCAPCREEMPSLDALQQQLGSERFRVVTVATGRDKPVAIRRFFESIGVTTLPQYRDTGQSLARQMGVFGLPVSMILDTDGMEIARIRGGADWSDPSARAVITALVANE